MRNRVALVVLVLVALGAGAAYASTRLLSRGGGEEESCRRYCLAVTPGEGDTGTVFRISGRGWRPRQRVRALYGPYCDARDCEDEGLSETFRADGRGRFTFRFRRGPEPLPRGTPEPAAQGGGPLRLEAWAGRPHESRRILREPEFTVAGAED